MSKDIEETWVNIPANPAAKSAQSNKGDTNDIKERFACDSCELPHSATYGDGELWQLCSSCYRIYGKVVSKIAFRAAQETNKAYEKGSSEQIRRDNDFIKHVQAEARINELTRLDNAYDDITPGNFHEYYIERIKALTADKEQA